MKNAPKNTIPVIRSTQTIPIEIHKEYLNYHDGVDLEKEKAGVAQKIAALFDATVSAVEKKRILFILGHCGTLESYNALKQYCETPDHDLAPWATLCLMECRSWLAGEILDDDSEMVMSGAGGDGTRLRFYFIITTANHRVITMQQQEIISGAAKTTAAKMSAMLESLSFGEQYAFLTVLISPDKAPAEVIEEIINECNSKEDFLRIHYFVSNVEKPTPEMIQQYLRELS